MAISGAVWSPPQDMALADVVKGIAMFKDLHVPMLGVVEDMSYYQYPHCGEWEYDLRGANRWSRR